MSLRKATGAMWKPAASPQRPRKPLQRKTKLRPVSAKRAARKHERALMNEQELAARPLCEAGMLIGFALALQGGRRGDLAGRWSGCLRKSTELHEPLTRGRAPGPDTIVDVVNSCASCSACHAWAHAHQALSESVGLLIPSHGRVGVHAFRVVVERAERAFERGLVLWTRHTPNAFTWQSRTHDGRELEQRTITLDPEAP